MLFCSCTQKCHNEVDIRKPYSIINYSGGSLGVSYISRQMKQERTLQEQASTYLQLVCSTCDLSDEKVQETASEIQQVKLQVSDK